MGERGRTVDDGSVVEGDAPPMVLVVVVGSGLEKER